ncbi:HPt (histidine-containing phosphotransfer) domain-containing protein [Mesorhizobium albiziae]|uniref:HPt (Histidine-containing phosphotransfer) domain-containing protein n=1 Tax=Neomesorhizobium albiziae TaxID=335020 RepID=A0A1I3YPL0_9HYPH|nr:Hpt domain-containing protein [Mesorhizobium albiziae]SFK33725.1 HPt (histidine-containing phosphotransfer) domain-containing protein [Mesorhizobium albiziae]
MASQGSRAVGLDRPGGETSLASPSRPIDLEHLSRQTLGDRKVEQEVLALFVGQALAVRDRILQADASERFQLAHGLKGSARGIGAFTLADCADRIEKSPDDRAALKRLAVLIDDVRDFIAAISR